MIFGGLTARRVIGVVGDASGGMSSPVGTKRTAKVLVPSFSGRTKRGFCKASALDGGAQCFEVRVAHLDHGTRVDLLLILGSSGGRTLRYVLLECALCHQDLHRRGPGLTDSMYTLDGVSRYSYPPQTLMA